jgi:hypothetical protein
MWRIYYDDGKIFTSNDGEWAEAPLDGVLFVLQKIGDRVVTQSGADYYYLIDGDVAGTGDLGPLLRQLKFIKFGRWTSIKKYEAVSKQVAHDAATWPQ